jgi:hypothetical protein
MNAVRVIKLRRMRWVGHVARMGAVKNAYNIWLETLKEKRTLKRHNRTREDNVRMDFMEIGL